MHEKITEKFLISQFISINIHTIKEKIKAKNDAHRRMMPQVTKNMKIVAYLYID